MKKYIFFENLYRGMALEKGFYFYCLLKQISLIKFLPLHLLLYFLRSFKIIKKEKYFAKCWGFLASVDNLDAKAEEFFVRRKKKLFCAGKDMWVLSEHPRCVLEKAFPQLIANVYDLKTKNFTAFKNVKEFISQDDYEAYGSILSPIMKNARVKHYIYLNREYKTVFGFVSRTALHYTVSYGLMCAFSVFIGVCSLYFACRNHENHADIFFAYFQRPMVAMVNIFPVLLLCALFYVITNSTAVASLLSSALVMILTWINYYKITFRNDPFLFGDLTIASEAKVMTETYAIILTPLIKTLILVMILFTLIMAIYFRARIKSLLVRALLFVLVILIAFQAYSRVYLDYDVYVKSFDGRYVKAWATNEHFVARGFLYPFIYSAQTAFETRPDGYDEDEIEKLLSAYSYTDIPEDKKVNIISIMLESYGDFSKFESLEFENDPYEIMQPIYENSYRGELITDIFSGGTVTSERQFLTGISTKSEYRKATNSYVWYFKDQGYRVEGGHPSYDWFYNRQNINPNFGFDAYYFDDNRYMDLNDGIRLANNDVLYADIMDLYDKAVEKGGYYFNFSVGYEGHGPYSYEAEFEKPYIVNKGYSDAVYNNINNYLSTIESTNESIVWLTEEIYKREEPTVLILFGDHMPGLGENNSGYTELGINIDLSCEEGFYNYYSTPYYIIANDAAKSKLDCDFTGEGPTIAPYFLMNEFFSLAGYVGDEFMQYSRDFYEEYKVIHTSGINIVNGEFVAGENDEKVNLNKCVEYYRRNKFSY